MTRVLIVAAMVVLLGTVALPGNGLKWLLEGYPFRDASLASAGDVDEYLLVYKGGQAVHIQAIAFAPQIELYDGVGTLIGAGAAPPGETHIAVTMQPGGSVTNILYLYVSGSGAPAYPAQYAAWLAAP